MLYPDVVDKVDVCVYTVILVLIILEYSTLACLPL